MNFLIKIVFRFLAYNSNHRGNAKLALLLSIISVCGCHSINNKPIKTQENTFSFPENKIWAHHVNSFAALENKHYFFDGLEVDLIYSRQLKEFYVAHHAEDTLKKLMLDEWIAFIPNPEKNWFWFDLKNLNKKNAAEIALLLSKIFNKYNIIHKTICEGRNVKALFILKKEGLAVSYWVSRDDSFRKITGNSLWKRKVKRNITYLQPDAISCSILMYPLFHTSFPEQNVLYWQIGVPKTPENVEFTKVLCNIPNVKVVLVDYDKSIPY
ncbi:MAG: hypothetical protein LBI45_08550 [Bacteroidales bacterium]|jgi:hypothetical protein|nr:hypothetical protein [Bacteroidales bacterium]